MTELKNQEILIDGPQQLSDRPNLQLYANIFPITPLNAKKYVNFTGSEATILHVIANVLVTQSCAQVYNWSTDRTSNQSKKQTINKQQSTLMNLSF